MYKYPILFSLLILVKTETWSQKSLYCFSEEILKEASLDKDNQDILWKLSFNGNYEELLKSWNENGYTDTKPILKISSQNKLRPTDAKSEILKKTKYEKIVIINEAHHIPLHRVFTESLLQEMYNQGFRYFGTEGIQCREMAKRRNQSFDTLYNNRKYPSIRMGYAINEPQYGNLIRKALKIGYTVFGYDTLGSRTHVIREQKQASNKKKVLDRDSSVRILIHCGYGHLCEKIASDTNFRMMGEYLSKTTRINPLTIDQQKFTEDSHIDGKGKSEKEFKGDKTYVLIDEKGVIYNDNYSKEDYLQDIIVYHPTTEYINGRPNWLYRDGTWYLKPIATNSIKIPYPILAMAYNFNEDLADAVPVDIIEILSPTENKGFVLPVGKYKILVKNKSGETQLTTLKVKK